MPVEIHEDVSCPYCGSRIFVSGPVLRQADSWNKKAVISTMHKFALPGESGYANSIARENVIMKSFPPLNHPSEMSRPMPCTHLYRTKAPRFYATAIGKGLQVKEVLKICILEALRRLRSRLHGFPYLPENIQTTEPAYHAEFRMEMLHSFSFDAGGTIDVAISKCKSLPSMQNASRGKHRAAARKRCKCARAATSCPTRDAVSPRSAYQIRRECAGAAADLFLLG